MIIPLFWSIYISRTLVVSVAKETHWEQLFWDLILRPGFRTTRPNRDIIRDTSDSSELSFETSEAFVIHTTKRASSFDTKEGRKEKEKEKEADRNLLLFSWKHHHRPCEHHLLQPSLQRSLAMAPDPKENGAVPERMDHDAAPPPAKPAAKDAKKKKDEKNKDDDLVCLSVWWFLCRVC